MAFSIGFFCSRSMHNVTLRLIQNLNGFFYRIFLFTLQAQRDALTHTKLRWLFYRILLFTLRAQRDTPTYTKLEWLFYRIFLFTLRAQHDAPTYTKTTDQCGARSGSPQLVIRYLYSISGMTLLYHNRITVHSIFQISIS